MKILKEYCELQKWKILSNNQKVIPLTDLLNEQNLESLGFNAFRKIITFTGSRSILDKDRVYRLLDTIVNVYEQMEVLKQDMLWITGGAEGVDKTVANYSEEGNIPFTIIPALWDKYGNKAGILRNIVMVDFADVVVGLWDGKSLGTKHCLDYAKKRNKQVHCFTIT